MAAGDQTGDLRSPLSRWRASGRRTSVPPPPAAETTEKKPALEPVVEARDPASILAAIEEGSASVVPPEVLALFLAPIREMLVLPPAERDPKALLLALDQVEDLLTAFFLCGPPKPEGT